MSCLVKVQDRGRVTLPTSVRKQLGLKKGDVVAVMATDEAIVIARRDELASAALDEIGRALHSAGVTLEELIDSARETRAIFERARQDHA
jgi:AbrB family looped-hinge helix DNA binding protein